MCAGDFVFLEDQHTLLFTTLTTGTRRADKVGFCCWWQTRKLKLAEPTTASPQLPQRTSCACCAINHASGPLPLLPPW